MTDIRLPVVAALVGALFLTGCGAGTGDTVRPVMTADPVTTFAPEIRLSDRERWWPISAQRFISYSLLEWSAWEHCPNHPVAIGKGRLRVGKDPAQQLIDPARLGGTSRPHSTRVLDFDCYGRRATYKTTQRTLPYDSLAKAGDLRDSEGFYLDILTDYREGNPNVGTVPAYFTTRARVDDGRPRLEISYWMLYGYNADPVETEDTLRLDHEGDWERLDVILERVGGRDDSRYLPLTVRYHRNGVAKSLPWGDAPLTGGRTVRAPTHPVAYAALGTHGVYERPARHPVRLTDDEGATIAGTDVAQDCAGCPRWQTWRSLRAVRDELWCGYGGGWGVAYENALSSGPPGPPC